MGNRLDEQVYFSQRSVDAGTDAHSYDVFIRLYNRRYADCDVVYFVFIEKDLTQFAHIHIFDRKGSQATGLLLL